MKILIAEDTEDSRVMLEMTLTGQGYEVMSAVDGLEALNLARKTPPDLIISDIMMPQMDGFELCRQLKDDPALKNIPLIFYTATYIERRDEELAMALGACRFVVKPQEPQVLVEIIQEVLATNLQQETPTSPEVCKDEYEIGEMYLHSVSRKLDKKVRELERERNALKESEELFRSVFDSVNDAIFIHDMETGAILNVNNTMCDMFGYRRAEIGELDVQDLSSGEAPYTGQNELEWLKKAVAGKPQVFEWQSKRKSGQLFWSEVNMKRAVVGSRERVLVVVRDITERKLAEECKEGLEAQLRQKYKMEALGVMAGGIAHDFNNNLAIILGNVELAQVKSSANSVIAPHLKNAKIAIFRARDLVKQILTYSRKGVQDIKAIELPLIVAETLELLRATIPATVDIETSIDPDDIIIKADATQIQEALINLCNNAVHAMDGSGILKIKLESVYAEQVDVPAQYAVTSSHFAKLSVRDSGSGMSLEIIEKIFDPFFTTKSVDEGTGMGLAVVHGIIESHGGFVRVNSQLGQGSTFELYFPIIESVQQEVVRTINNPHDQPTGDAQILVVDDAEKLLNEVSH